MKKWHLLSSLIGVHSVIFKNLLNVVKLFFCCSAEDDDVIQVDDSKGEIF